MDHAFTPRLRLARVPCPCCGFVTLEAPGEYDICVLCNWEDEGLGEADLDERSGANHGYTLRRARENFTDHRDMYDKGDAAAKRSPAKVAAKKQLIAAFRALRARPADEHEALWATIEHAESAIWTDLQRESRQFAERVDNERSSAQSESEQSLIPIGYWHSEDNDGLPHPQTLVSWTWQFGRRWRIVRYLRKGSQHIQYCGWS
jgi:Cysteine-rich CPCC